MLKCVVTVAVNLNVSYKQNCFVLLFFVDTDLSLFAQERLFCLAAYRTEPFRFRFQVDKLGKLYRH